MLIIYAANYMQLQLIQSTKLVHHNLSTTKRYTSYSWLIYKASSTSTKSFWHIYDLKMSERIFLQIKNYI
jgi:hypothetical protein